MLLPRSLVLSLSLILTFTTPSPAEPPKKLLLLGQGPDGHPPETHEYMAGLQILTKCLKPIAELDVSVVRADEPWKEGPDLLERTDGVVLYLAEGARWLANDARRQQAFAKLASRKGGLVALHWAIGTRDAAPIDNYLKLLGGCHGGPDRKFQVLETETQVTNPQHPITFGISNFRIRDEFYYRLKFAKPEANIQPLLRASIDGQEETVAWSWERPDGGRSFGFSGLHFHDNWRLPEYRRLVAQGILWTLNLPIPKNGLPVQVTPEELKLK